MTTPSPARLWPGADPKTGWPVEPKHPCYQGPDPILMQDGKIIGAKDLKKATAVIVSPVICHLRLGGGPMVCGYEPGDCPFYGRYPASVSV